MAITSPTPAFLLQRLRQQHGVSLQRVRKALRFVERRLHLPHPLITAKFRNDGVDLFVKELGKLINASSDGQTVMADALQLSLARVEHDQDGLAARLFPFVRGEGREPKVIVVDPRLSFGKPVVAATGVPSASSWAAIEREKTFRLSPRTIESR